MLKTIAFIARKNATPREDFREHYEEIHVPLALPHLPGLCRYVRNHVLTDLGAGGTSEAVEPGFDCATGFWFPDPAALHEVTTHLASEAAAEICEDELSFMNTEANVFCAAVETLVRGPDRDDDIGPSKKVLALAKRTAQQSRDEFISHYEENLLPSLLESSPQPLRCIQNQTIGVAGMEPPFDCVTELWYSGDESTPAALSRPSPDTQRLLVLRVLECETAFSD